MKVFKIIETGIGVAALAVDIMMVKFFYDIRNTVKSKTK